MCCYRPACLAVLSLASLAWGEAVVGQERPKQPLNVILLLADDLGWADLGCYGADLNETPNLDRFAAGAMRFTDAYAAAPVCTPTRASILTGKWPAKLHITIWRESAKTPTLAAKPKNKKGARLATPVTVADLPHEETTLAEVFREAGYLTAHVGKWHLGDSAFYPETQGFDINIGGTHWGAPQTFFYPYRGAGSFGSEYRYVPHLEWGEPGEFLTDRLTSEALQIIQRAKDRPFFLNLWWHAVHTPIEAKPDVVERFQKKLRPGLNHTNATYAALLYILDQNVGRILAKLDELGIADRTVVLFTSDNGGFINQFKGQTVTNNTPLRSGKGSLWEGGVRVPLVVRWPGVTRAGATCAEPVSSIDFYPTILEMAGLPGDPKHNAKVDGKSLVPLLKDPAERLPREELYFHYPHYYQTTSPVSSVRQRDWKLIEFHEDMHAELYNLKDDPSEKQNLAGQIPDRAESLRKKLHAWRETVDAQMPTPP